MTSNERCRQFCASLTWSAFPIIIPPNIKELIQQHVRYSKAIAGEESDADGDGAEDDDGEEDGDEELSEEHLYAVNTPAAKAECDLNLTR